MKFIRVKATGERNSEDKFNADFLLNTDLIAIITLDGKIILKEDGNLNVSNNFLLGDGVSFGNVRIHEDFISDFLNKYAYKQERQ